MLVRGAGNAAGFFQETIPCFSASQRSLTFLRFASQKPGCQHSVCVKCHRGWSRGLFTIEECNQVLRFPAEGPWKHFETRDLHPLLQEMEDPGKKTVETTSQVSLSHPPKKGVLASPGCTPGGKCGKMCPSQLLARILLLSSPCAHATISAPSIVADLKCT